MKRIVAFTAQELEAFRRLRFWNGFLSATRQAIRQVEALNGAGVAPSWETVIGILRKLEDRGTAAAGGAVLEAMRIERERFDRARSLPEQSDSTH